MALDNRVSSLSQSRSLEEMAEFWDTHDGSTAPHVCDLRQRRHYIAVDPDALTRLREAALARGLGIESLASLWLQERALTLAPSFKAVAEAREKYG